MRPCASTRNTRRPNTQPQGTRPRSAGPISAPGGRGGGGPAMSERGASWVDEALREHEEHTAAEHATAGDEAAKRGADIGAGWSRWRWAGHERAWGQLGG